MDAGIWIVIGLLLALAVAFACSKPRKPRASNGPAAPPGKSSATARHRSATRPVIKGRAHIIDGDTIVINRLKIRLAGIDAPELDMPWGQKSKWAMVDICKGQVITALGNGETSCDRIVATCYLPDGRDIGAELVKRGLALDLPHFSGGVYRCHEPEGARRRLGNGQFGHRSKWETSLGRKI